MNSIDNLWKADGADGADGAGAGPFFSRIIAEVGDECPPASHAAACRV